MKKNPNIFSEQVEQIVEKHDRFKTFTQQFPVLGNSSHIKYLGFQ